MSKSRLLSLLSVLYFLVVAFGCAEQRCVCPERDTGTIFADDFEDGDLVGWSDHTVCSTAGSHQFAVLFSEEDASKVLQHQGGYSAGGGNGEFVVAAARYCNNVVVQADIRNVEAFHTTAKAVGLSACLDEESGVQYLAWYCVCGDLFLYRTGGWFSCGPDPLAHVKTPAIGIGQEIQMVLSVMADSLSVAIDGNVVLACEDTGDHLTGGGVGLVATAGITYFDNVSVKEIK